MLEGSGTESELRKDLVEPTDQDCSLFVDQLPVLDNAGVSVCTSESGDAVARSLGSVVVGTEIPDVCV